MASPIATMRVLIAEDNLDIAENIGDFLEMNGHHVDYAYDGLMAVELFNQHDFDVVVMDIMMPKVDGLKATEQIRQSPRGDVPIIMLTAKDTLAEKLDGFTAGADDYLVKPFAMPELYARLQAQVRKSQTSYHHQFSVENIMLDHNDKSAAISGKPLVLNPTTFKIMWQLAKAYPNLVAKAELEFLLWGDLPPENDILRSHIYNLRQSLAKCNDDISILAKHGQGYQLVLKNKLASTHKLSK
ncbi:DNA-binding response regulator [Colwellia sp. 75C3]|uniref:response regulator transcription factor n=1 Tax=Colwellia sp. 75C3 TaxID=888425 RepID=UPI000C346831|nr:response regulator transcription factor [Colwellia sp. 75C3]PKG83169.1 DNA-binding response regulator [Colwellia sp. 75C3]